MFSVLFFVLSALGSAIGALYGSFTAPFFSSIIPSLLVHPSFVAKIAALAVYAFSLFQGLFAAGVAIDPDKLMRNYTLITVAPLLCISALYLFLTASFIFSLFFYVPLLLCVLGFWAVAWRILQLVRRGSQWSGKVESYSLNRMICCNPLKPVASSLWWLPDEALLDTLKNMKAATTMLLVVLFSTLLIVLSPALVFGPWAAFYSYLGHAPSDNISLAYSST
jgi:hypothetical protein